MKRGFSLLELLLALGLLGLLLLAVALASAGFLRESRGYTAREGLLGEVDLLAEALRREAGYGGYRVVSGGIEVALEAEGDALYLRYLCEGDLLQVCGPEGEGRVRVSLYRSEGGSLRHGACLEGLDCASGRPPRLGEASRYALESFRVAYRRNGAWLRGAVVANRNTSPIEGLAVYLRLATLEAVGAPPFTPGSQVAWPAGLTPGGLGLPTAPLADGRLRAERLLVVDTFNTC